MISVIILTKNEEKDLPSCLESLHWTDDIHIVDSGSTDNTITIGKKYGASIMINAFKSFGHQRNFALDNLMIKYDWILFLDADEVATDKFYAAVKSAINNVVEDTAGFYCCWKMILEGRWLKRSDNFPKWQFRLLRKGRARFTDFGHGQKETEIRGKIGYIKEPYLHYAFSKGWIQWKDRHNRYSDQEAVARYTSRPPFKNIFKKNSSVRNPALKAWLSMVPGWPAIRFLYTYFLNFGFLEGKQGFQYCFHIARYEWLIQKKMRKLKSEVNKKYNH